MDPTYHHIFTGEVIRKGTPIGYLAHRKSAPNTDVFYLFDYHIYFVTEKTGAINLGPVDKFARYLLCGTYTKELRLF